MQFKRQPLEAADVNITPLIDVVFLLLIFFMVSTRLPDQALNLQLPTASTAETQPEALPEISVLSLYADGSILFNEQTPTSLETLEAQLNEQLQNNPEAIQALLIQAENTTHHQNIVSALDLARRLGIEKVRIATQPLELK
ncbi:ExbD/TolR family protein [Marinospirillum insulare]|uniref:Biopolymer transporter ExbD n=1 Tax=Marinospirillum insulare TaxID=217169 RepID=A0ABQ5ZXG8_9GAMM|nr:biopolymer transporter ExbD [Marinospirillum insulare]GLR64684.1 biopolymer transporter ExbD [Marinospirillum insulare]